MEEWIKEKTKTVIKQIDTLEEFKEVSGKRLAILLLTSEENDEQLRIFGTVAHNYEGIPFYYSFSEQLRTHFNTGSDFSLVMVRGFDDGQKILNHPSMMTSEILKEFIDVYRYPIVMDFDQEAAERVFSNRLSAMILFTDEKET